MNNISAARSAISIDFKKNRIRIHKNALHAIGDPEYILFLVNPEELTLAVMRSNCSDLRAHRITHSSLAGLKSCELCSKSLVRELLNIYSGWHDNNIYRITGNVVCNKGIVTFHIEDSVRFVK